MSSKTFTEFEIHNKDCWSCKKKSNTNRIIELIDKDGTPINKNPNDPIVLCCECRFNLYNKKHTKKSNKK